MRAVGIRPSAENDDLRIAVVLRRRALAGPGVYKLDALGKLNDGVRLPARNVHPLRSDGQVQEQHRFTVLRGVLEPRKRLRVRRVAPFPCCGPLDTQGAILFGVVPCAKGIVIGCRHVIAEIKPLVERLEYLWRCAPAIFILRRRV